jgi:hypothetical protein
MAAATRKELLKKVYNMVPPMLESFHKGPIRIAYFLYSLLIKV